MVQSLEEGGDCVESHPVDDSLLFIFQQATVLLLNLSVHAASDPITSFSQS